MNPWMNVGVYNNFFYDPYWAWNGFNPYYCPGNVWANNQFLYPNEGNNGFRPTTYVGPRRSGSGPQISNSGFAAITSDGNRGRLVQSDRTSPEIDLRSFTPSRVISDREPVVAPPARTGTGQPTAARPSVSPQPSRETSNRVQPSRETPNRTQPAAQPSRGGTNRNATQREPSPTRRQSEAPRSQERSNSGFEPSRSFDAPSRSFDAPSRSSSPGSSPRSGGFSPSSGGSPRGRN